MVWLKPQKVSAIPSPLWIVVSENDFFRLEKSNILDKFRIVFKFNNKDKYVVAIAETENEINQ